MTNDVEAIRGRFRALHEQDCFVLANVWDAGSAVRAAKLGYRALASTSAGFAWSLARKDYEVTRDELLAHLRMLSAATALPVNADFEGGFAIEPPDVAANVWLAIDTGVAGLSIEDRLGEGLFDFGTAVERIRAARAAIDASGTGTLLVGRCEGYLTRTAAPAEIRERIAAYAAAGAHCVFAPGVTAADEIRALVEAAGPTPLNVLLMNPAMRVPELAALGVRRVSVGGHFAGAAYAAYEKMARTVLEEGVLG